MGGRHEKRFRRGRGRTGGADVVEETGRRICWREIAPKHNRFGADDSMGLGVGVDFDLLFRIHVKESTAASDKPCLEYVLVV